MANSLALICELQVVISQYQSILKSTLFVKYDTGHSRSKIVST